MFWPPSGDFGLIISYRLFFSPSTFPFVCLSHCVYPSLPFPYLTFVSLTRCILVLSQIILILLSLPPPSLTLSLSALSLSLFLSLSLSLSLSLYSFLVSVHVDLSGLCPVHSILLSLTHQTPMTTITIHLSNLFSFHMNSRFYLLHYTPPPPPGLALIILLYFHILLLPSLVSKSHLLSVYPCFSLSRSLSPSLFPSLLSFLYPIIPCCSFSHVLPSCGSDTVIRHRIGATLPWQPPQTEGVIRILLRLSRQQAPFSSPPGVRSKELNERKKNSKETTGIHSEDE